MKRPENATERSGAFASGQAREPDDQADSDGEQLTQEPSSERQSGNGTAARRVLVVDDEPTLRMGFGIALTTDGFEVEEAADGDAALQCLNTSDGPSFDAMLLDLRMPGKSGIEVMRELDCERGRPLVPTVIVSAHMDPYTCLESIALGVVDFLKKPATPSELRGVVARMVEEEKAVATARDNDAPLSEDPSEVESRETALALARWHLRRKASNEAAEALRAIDDAVVNGEVTEWRRITEGLLRKSHGESGDWISSFVHSERSVGHDPLKLLAYNG